jgi:hypothetical protein
MREANLPTFATIYEFLPKKSVVYEFEAFLKETSMFTRNLLKPLLMFTLLTLLLMPQVAASGTALAAKPTTRFAIAVPTGLPLSPDCLSLTSSSVAGAQTVTVANPPGGGVKYSAYLLVQNNCTTGNPVSLVTINTTTIATCPAESNNEPRTDSYKIPDLAQGSRLGKLVINIGSCVVSVNNVPTASIIPTSIKINIDAFGISASGQQVVAPGAVLNVTW